MKTRKETETQMIVTMKLSSKDNNESPLGKLRPIFCIQLQRELLFCVVFLDSSILLHFNKDISNLVSVSLNKL